MRGHTVFLQLCLSLLCVYVKSEVHMEWTPPVRDRGQTDEQYAAVMARALEKVLQTPDQLYMFYVDKKEFYGKNGFGLNPKFKDEFKAAQASAEKSPQKGQTQLNNPIPPHNKQDESTSASIPSNTSPQNGQILLNDPIPAYNKQAGKEGARAVAKLIVDNMREVWNTKGSLTTSKASTMDNCIRAMQGQISMLKKMKQADATLLYVLPTFYEELNDELDMFFKNDVHDKNAPTRDSPIMDNMIAVNIECLKPLLKNTRI